MPLDLISEDEVRAALRRHRPDAEAFEAGVRERLTAMEKEREDDPLAGLPPLARSAAALLPLQLLAAGKLPAAAAAKLLPATGIYKLLGYLAFPAISLFALLGALLFGAAKIRQATETGGLEPGTAEAMRDAMQSWWRSHRWGFWLVFATTMLMQWIGETWVLFLLYIVSLGLLVYVISALAKIGLGNRTIVGQSCMMSLMMLGQWACFAGTGNHDIHFVDQPVIGAVFLAGALLLALYMTATGVQPRTVRSVPPWLVFGLMALVGIPLMVFYLNPILFPVTDARIKSYVESQEQTLSQRYYWQKWEVVADWAIERGLEPDLSAARRALADVIQARPERPWPDSVVLSCAMRLELIDRQMLDEPRWAEVYEHFRHDLFSQRDSQKRLEEAKARQAENRERTERERAERQAERQKKDAELAARDPEEAARRARHRAEREQALKEARPHPPGNPVPGNPAPAAQVPADLQPINSIDGAYWMMRAAMLRGDLTNDDRDFLESRLHATLEHVLSGGSNDIDDLVWATRELAVIGRPVDAARYRQRIHQYLLGRFCEPAGPFQRSGGFGKYRNLVPRGPEPRTWTERAGRWLGDRMLPPGTPLPSIEGTAAAVELMQTYGVPSEIDLNWVRSYLKPGTNDFFSDERWLQAVTRDRVDRLPGAAPPAWPEWLFAERSLLAAMVMVGLCIYATLASPKSRVVEEANSRPDFDWAPAPPLRRIVLLVVVSVLFAVAAMALIWSILTKPPVLPVVPQHQPIVVPPRRPMPPPGGHRPDGHDPSPKSPQAG